MPVTDFVRNCIEFLSKASVSKCQAVVSRRRKTPAPAFSINVSVMSCG